MIELKRKREYPQDMCAARGCRRRTGLQWYDVPKGKKVVRVPICDTCTVGLSEPLSPAVQTSLPLNSQTQTESQEEPKGLDDGVIRALRWSDIEQLTMSELPGVRLQWSLSSEEVDGLVSTGLGLKRPDPPANPLNFEICWLSEHQKLHYKPYDTTAKELAELFESSLSPMVEEPAEKSLQDRIAEEHAETKEALSLLDDISVTSAEDEQFVQSLLADVKGKNNRLEDMKQRAVKPMNQSIKEIRSWFAPAQSALRELETELKSKILGYRRLLEKERREALERMAKAETVEEAKEAKTAIEKTKTPDTSGIIVNKVWTYEVVDIAQVAQFDPSLVQLNKGAIRKQINGGARKIPGLRIFQKDSVSAKAS